jgi:hypothetical protein
MPSDENKIFSDPRLINLFKKMQEVTQSATKPYAIRGDKSHMVISRRKPAVLPSDGNTKSLANK